MPNESSNAEGNEMNDRLVAVLGRARDLAFKMNHRYVLTEHLFLEMMKEHDVMDFYLAAGIDAEKFKEHLRKYLKEVNQKASGDPIKSQSLSRIFERAYSQARIAGIEPSLLGLIFAVLQEPNTVTYILIEKTGGKCEEMYNALLSILGLHNGGVHDRQTLDLSNILHDSILVGRTNKEKNNNNSSMDDFEQILDEYCINLNELAKDDKIDPIIGRDNEIKKILKVLGKKIKRNAILVGDAGTGKSAIIDGLALRLVAGDVPSQLKDCEIYSLDLGALVAGTRYRGDFEERLKQIIDAFKGLKNSILFIDEMHMAKGSGAAGDGTMDVANILKPALARGEIRVIGATTTEEYRKYIEKDKALARRFFRVQVDEPSLEETKKILLGVVGYFEKYHGIEYTHSALERAVDLADKHIHNKQLPDKAFDIIDAAGSYKKLYGEAEENKPLVVTDKDIEAEVSLMVNIPKISIEQDDAKRYKSLKKELKERIFGQNHAIDILIKYVLITKSGLREPHKPQVSVLFRGPTGCGKTELAKQMAELLDIKLIRFDMSEYHESHTISKFIGAPPGYVGYGDGDAGDGLLLSAIEKDPNCVLLLDEIEKAHPDVLNILLQIMDYGMLSSSSGKQVSFRNVNLLMTSNLGAGALDKNPMGFGRSNEEQTIDENETKKFLSPEFRNRLDAIITFNKLHKDQMMMIVDKFIDEMNVMLQDKKVSIKLSEAAKEKIIQITADQKMGARPIATEISNKIKSPLSEKILFNKLKDSLVFVDLDGEEFILNIEQLQTIVDDKENIDAE